MKIKRNQQDGKGSLTWLLVVAPLCVSAILFASTFRAAPNESESYTLVVAPPQATPSPTPDCPLIITHSTSQTITSGNSVSCNNGVGHTDNSYWRAFNMMTFAGGHQFIVTSVSFGVESVNQTQPVTVRLYANNGGAFPGGTRTQLATSTVDVTTAQSGTILSIPLTATVPAGTGELVMELFTPDGEAAGNLFFVGSNTAPQTGPSYISAPACGITTPTDLAAVGFPNMHIVFNVHGGCEGSPTPTATVVVTPCPNSTVFFINFDNLTAPALPAGWSATNAAGPPPLWVTTTTMPLSAPNDAFVDEPAVISDKFLDTHEFPVGGENSQFQFESSYNLENGFDGGVLEVSSPNINGGAFIDVTDPAVGGSFLIGGYNTTISTSFGSPITGRMAWSGNSNTYTHVIANLGPNVIGHYVKVRFRMASDNSGSGAGWRIDEVRLAVFCGTPSPTPTTPPPTPTVTPTSTVQPTVTATPGITPCADALSFLEHFDGVTAPALPSGWSATNAAGPPPLWVTSTTTPNSPPNDAFIDDPTTVSDKRLDTPDLPINGQGAQLHFSNFYNLESTFDGGVLEVSSDNINGGAFTDITDPAVGGTFVTGGYNAMISTSSMSPIAGRMAWSGNSGGYIQTVANLGFNVVGHFIKLRFRMASDNSGGGTGWRVDDVGASVFCETPTPPPPTPTPSPTCPQAITQSTSFTITPGNSVSCNNGTGHTDNSYWRAFNMGTFTGGAAFPIGSVSFGIESVNNPEPVTVRLYTNNGGAFPAGTRTQIATQTLNVTSAQSGGLISIAFPGVPTVPAGTGELVMEVFTPDGQAAGNLFFVGSNAEPETGPSYLSAPDCGITTPTQMAALGFPNMHIVFKVDRYCEGTPSPTATVPPTVTPTPSDCNPPFCTATPTATATVPATATPTVTPTATPTPSEGPCPGGSCTPTPTPTPAPRSLNLSTRMLVQTGDNVGIGGFIITGTAQKQILVRAIGPSLGQFGVPDFLADPTMELHGPGGFTTLINDNWRDTQEAEIISTGIPPTNDLESAILATVDPGNYTAVVRGKNDGTGVGLVEVYDLGAATSQLANLSTRVFCGTADDVVIAGFILGEGSTAHIVIRGIGPSLINVGILNPLPDPTLELRDINGTLLAANDNCGMPFAPRDKSNDGPIPLNSCRGTYCPGPLEACIDGPLQPGTYTAILAGKDGATGVALVEIYNVQ